MSGIVSPTSGSFSMGMDQCLTDPPTRPVCSRLAKSWLDVFLSPLAMATVSIVPGSSCTELILETASQVSLLIFVARELADLRETAP